MVEKSKLNKIDLLVIVPGIIPTVEIIIGTLYTIKYYNIKVVFDYALDYSELFSGRYKILIVRSCSPALKPLLYLLVKFKVPYLYYLDDNFWELKGDSPLALYYQNPEVQFTLKEFIENAYLTIAGSQNLKKYLAKYTFKCAVVRAAFNFKLIEQCIKNNKTDHIKILYSGTLYRDSDFKYVLPALKIISEEYDEKISIYFKGFVPEELKSLSNVYYEKKFLPYNSFIKSQYEENFSIGLAPLDNGLSSQAKSNLKYREYGACGIAGVYANQSPYSDCITSEQNGLLVEPNSNDWYKAIKRLIDDKNLRENIATNAAKDIALNYNHDSIAKEWEQVLLILPKTKKVPIFIILQIKLRLQANFINIKYKFKRICHYLRHEGCLFTMKKILHDILKKSKYES